MDRFKGRAGEAGRPGIVNLIDRSNELQSTILFRFLPRGGQEVFKNCITASREIIDGLASHATHLSNLMNDMEPDNRTALFENSRQGGPATMQLLSMENLQRPLTTGVPRREHWAIDDAQVRGGEIALYRGRHVAAYPPFRKDAETLGWYTWWIGSGN